MPSEEDLIIRYLEHLTFLAVRRNSFYVTLAIGSLLHQFDRRETRLFYDILTQNDSARMKDTAYIGKQRLDLMQRLSQRFDGMMLVENKSGYEKQFQMRGTDESIINLVRESLRRFTPAETECVIDSRFDPTDMSAFYFSGDSGDDEDLVELRRVHAVMNPACFDHFCRGLAAYVPTLPKIDLDRTCNFESPDNRLTLPRFSNFQNGGLRSDRHKPPQFTDNDYLRLQRMLSARRQHHRR